MEEVSQRSKYDRLEEAAAEQVTQIKLHSSDKRGIVPWPGPRPALCHVLEAISNSFVISRTIFRIHLVPAAHLTFDRKSIQIFFSHYSLFAAE